jgi:adenylate cyclase
LRIGKQAIEWCEKSIAGNSENWFPYVDVATSNAWLGRDKEARDAAAQLQKLFPRFTVQTFAGITAQFTSDPTFTAQIQRILEGLRKAGLPEGDKNTN